MYTKCIKCKIPILTHFWVERVDGQDKIYCAPGCVRGAKGQFDVVLKKMNKLNNQASLVIYFTILL